ncbi:MarR family winged helix-turn-helix transcriptional regulator [Kangiella marina]|uniref:HTH marR-type domain-containing protein n=1 Tax=Kangiella marina TaxID=1079178 RepID=A0ABP8I9W3_9GAMM
MTNELSTDMETTETYELDQHLPYRIAVISNILQLGRDIEIRKITDLGSRELRVLLNVGTYTPVSAAQIAFQTKLDSYTISRGVKALLNQGLIEKRALPNNKKEKLLYLTDKGQAVYTKVTASLTRRDEQFASFLTKKQRTELIKNLKKLEQQAVELLAQHAIAEQNEGIELSGDQKEIIRWFNKMD